MVKVLSVLVLVFSFVQSCCQVSPIEPEVIGDLTIHCGRSDTSIVNITYYGDINMMFIEDKYEECSSEEISPAHHVIYNINGRDCGFQEFNNTNTWAVTVRLQKGFLVTAADKKVNLVCAYDDDVAGGTIINSTYDPVQPQQMNKINTENVM
ncbi:hypothetical protein LOTGIDRAFT_166149 [Lottia gigantea]|uniref:ZP domain-containing protein n=1 Tax=Lottia gigantea TaxID=225164 RepID=V3ZA72_LOTGI|nr:hypothetical protein LOTGIDRAFT_166149 [Lottia gigantea]ESO87848.1 hypothetical protein LOTGIDRAFT_166149 [Lottia gigantea]